MSYIARVQKWSIGREMIVTHSLPNFQKEIGEEMARRGWKRGLNVRGEVEYVSPSGDHCVQIDPDEYHLCRFDDSDNADGVATARWVRIIGGVDLSDLREDLEKLT